jgi:uncharacterized membrane protein
MDEVIEPTKNKLDSAFLLITKLSIVFSTLFLIIGVSYSLGIDAGYGMSSEVPSTELSIFSGFFIFYGSIGDVFNVLISGMIDFWNLLAAIFFASLGIGALLPLLFSAPRFRKHEKMFDQQIDKLSHTSASLGSLFLVLGFLLSFPVSAFTAGKLNSETIIEQLRESGCSRSYKNSSDWSLCSEVFVDDVSILKGYMIYRKNNEVAFITLKEQALVIRQIPANAIVKRMKV